MDMRLVEPIGAPGFPTAVGAAFGTFTTKKSIDPLPVPVIPAGKLGLGTKLRCSARGEFSTTGTPTIQLGFWIGTRALSITVDLALSAAITTGSGAAAWPWHLWWEGLCTAIGTAGSLVGHGYLVLGTSLTAVSLNPIPTTAAARTVAIDTTIERAVGVSGAWGTSSASNTMTCYEHRAEILN